MDNPSFVCENFNHSKMIDAEAKLLLVFKSSKELLLTSGLTIFPNFPEKAQRGFCQQESGEV